MAQIEIDENELVGLKNVATLFNKTLNGKGREKLLRALKEGNPDLPIPELDAKDPILEEMRKVTSSVDEIKKQIEDEKSKREEEKNLAALQSKWNEGRAKVAKQGYSGDSLTALEKFMEDNGVADHVIAAAAFEKLNPPAKPVDSVSGKFDFFTSRADDSDKLAKKLWSNDSSYLDDAINQTLLDMRGAA
jgi:hypothetical protein